ncbi:phage tail spike protein [uncultured Streptococcus sp.]|uniref:phage tail spike protein n=1 Tax=uncultured Streptococcus sp. TaxID=83427 RepID=UPI0025F5436B|nr:phage tail spike protein [uncultured Streptococcus sp.]
MLYLLNKDVRTVRWNGEPLHEATSAIVKEIMNGDFTLTVKYPISDSGIYQLIQEDMLIKAPTPVLGAQLFRIKKPVEHNDHLEITAYHISDDVMQRSITPVSVTSQSCSMALSRMVQNTKTSLGDFSFNSDIQDRRTFNTTETETLYSVLLDGKHSIVGTWEGELVRDNFALTVKRSRGENRGVVITTHKNLKDYQRTKNSQNVVTRIHAKSTFKPEGAEKETTIRVTVDSPLINSYPYINEKEYENNNAKTVEELQKWAQAKFSNEGIDKVSDAVKIEAYELDGQVVHMGDTVNLKSWKHNVDAFKKAIAYEFDALKEEYISLTFDDKASTGGSRASGGLSSAANAILGVTESAQEIALEKALQNADLDFDHKAGLLRQEISDGIELARARAEEVKRELSDTIDQRFSSFDNGPLQEAKRKAEEALRNAGASSLLAQEAKRISERARADITNLQVSSQNALSQIESFKNQYGTKLNEFKSTSDGILTKLGAIETYVNQDGQRQESLQRYAREESARQATAVRELVTRDYVGKSTYQEDARALERKFEAITNPQNGSIATQIANYKTAVDGRFTEITSMISGKANQVDFQQVRETSRLYERTIGSNENDISNKVARMALTSQLFQVEVAKSLGSDNNLIVRSKSMDRHTLVNEGNTKRVFVNNGIFTIRCTGNSGYTFAGFTLPLYIDRMARSETYTLNFKYRIMGRLDHNFVVVTKNHETNETAIASDVATSSTAVSSNWQEFNETYTISRDFEFRNSELYPLYFYLAKNGWVEIKEIMLVRASQTNGYKASQLDDMSEAVRSVQSQLAGSWSVQNINSAGDLVSGLNLGANGHNRLSGKLTHITGETLIDKAVIKSAMIDKLKTANFESGSVTTVILDAEAVTADKVRMDQAFANKLVASNIFTDTLAAKEAFINKLRSVVVTANLLEGFQGLIGGFRFGQYANRNGYFITGINSVSIGMGNGTNAGANRNAFWANWGESLDTPGPKAWYVNTDGKMYCRNDVDFYSKVDFASTSKVNFYSRINAPKGIWIASDDINGEGDNPDGGYNRVVWWSQIVTGKWRQHAGITTGSDRKLKENIEPTSVKALDKINALNLVAFDYIKDKTHEEIGLIAQEVLNIIPGAVEKYEGEDNHLTINYSKFVPYLIKAIQELNSKLEKIA